MKLVIQSKASSAQNLAVNLTLLQRSNYTDVTWNTTVRQADTTTVPSGYVEYIGERSISSTTNNQVELYYNNVKKFETSSTGATVTGTLVADGVTLE